MAAPTDPAIRSVRVAAALNERFAAIMRAPLTQADGMGALELRIGEAQQIYPEIWGHLDDARTTLATREVSTTAYDAIRATEPKGSIGVSRVEVEGYATTLSGHVLGLHDEQVKSAHFNLEGHRRATRAIRALMEAMPEVDWKGLERAENAEIAAAGSLGPLNPRSVGTWLAILGGIGAVAYGFWFLVIRIPPRDHAGERKARIVEYRKAADEHPCKKTTVESLANELAWDEPRVPSKETRTAYRATCKDSIVRFEAALAVNACDKPALDGLTTALADRDGHIDKALAARNEYDARCREKP